MDTPVDYPAEVFDRIEVLRGSQYTVTALPGGLTNHNYKVVTATDAYVVRVSESQSTLLAIDRDAEYANSCIAAEVGIGAPVHEYRPQDAVLVLGFLPGRTYTNESFGVQGVIPRVATAVRTLHGAKPFVRDFDMFAIQRRYRATLAEHGFAVPAGYDELAAPWERMRGALAASASGLVPCNNDLLAGNFIDDGETIRLIDYEYSGNNDPCFELGNIGAECALDDDQLTELVHEYFQAPLAHKVARARALSVVSKYGWTLWGAIQHAVSPLEFDFWGWGMERFEAAAVVLTSDRLDHLLNALDAEG